MYHVYRIESNYRYYLALILKNHGLITHILLIKKYFLSNEYLEPKNDKRLVLGIYVSGYMNKNIIHL